MVKLMKNIKIGTYIKGDETFNFNFGTSLSAYDKMVFVNFVIDLLIDDKTYDSIIRDLITDFVIIRVFTDIDTSFVNVKDDENNIINPIILIEQFLEETNIVDIVKANMEDGLFEELNKAIDKSIQYRTGIHPSPLSDSLSNLVNTIDKKIKDIDLSSMSEMIQLFTGMTDEFTPENVVNAYLNSDIHKNNVIEIEESKKQRVEFAEDMDKAIESTSGTKKPKSKSKK